ncbi:DUF3703 domain-containing protein [Noviherbaspirillum galbum]|uniref:DUF3703 domain-containing protein n=1 Tax=Noviherbaspirillum galbum TaxID=2709383 RepID=A0A6B3SNU7_9BURK|nr:DUF3703 domain-containing protein [Noviherbaspirillum galbum]NEX60955.1 DUF3703 domain-containing protein [Noviherbaspirillum galbum]
MNPTVRHAFNLEMAAAHRLLTEGDVDNAFIHLERAHVVGQRYVIPHVQTHWHMLRIGLLRRSVPQVWGQAVRIVLGALGSAVGVVPTGNTGGTNISMFARMPIHLDIQRILGKE